MNLCFHLFGLAGRVGLNCVLAMRISSCNPSKKVEDTSLSLLTSTLHRLGRPIVCTATGQPRTPGPFFRKKTQCCRVHLNGGDLWIANQIVLDLPSTSEWTRTSSDVAWRVNSGLSDSVSLSQDHGKTRNRRHHLLVLHTSCVPRNTSSRLVDCRALDALDETRGLGEPPRVLCKIRWSNVCNRNFLSRRAFSSETNLASVSCTINCARLTFSRNAPTRFLDLSMKSFVPSMHPPREKPSPVTGPDATIRDWAPLDRPRPMPRWQPPTSTPASAPL